jgi:hypothetical protein
MATSEWLSDSPWDVSYTRSAECESPDYESSEYRRLRYAWLYEDEDIWAAPDPSLS